MEIDSNKTEAPTRTDGPWLSSSMRKAYTSSRRTKLKRPTVPMVMRWSNQNAHMLFAGAQNGRNILEKVLTLSYKTKPVFIL